MILQVLGAFLAITAFSIVIDAPKKLLPYCGITGAVSWLVYLLALDRVGTVFASFLGALVISMLSHIFARIFKTPVTVLLIPGILTLVPGAWLYRTVYQFFLGNRAVASVYLLETIQIAGMIALAIFVMDSFFAILQHKVWRKH